eukprot:gene1914-2092_t
MRTVTCWLVIALFQTACVLSFKQVLYSPPQRSRVRLSPDDLAVVVDGSNLAWAALLGGSLWGLSSIVGYAKSQYAIANLVGGIPKGSDVVEIDPIDGKNVFYLPATCTYTAIMPIDPSLDAKRSKERQAFNEKMVLESVAKANAIGLSLTGKVRTALTDLPAKSVDCVVSVGALDRRARDSEQAKNLLVNEVYRVLRPGGLFVFYEPVRQSSVSLKDIVLRFFPAEIRGGMSAAKRLKQSKAISKNKSSEKEGKKRRSLREQIRSEEEALQSASSTFAAPALVDEAVQEEGVDKEVVQSESNEPVVRPGLSYEEMSVLPWLKVATGIAIKP